MMNAMPQTPSAPGFAAFLATIGQSPAKGAEAGGFDQLLAALPASAPAAAQPTTPVAEPAPVLSPAPTETPMLTPEAKPLTALPAAQTASVVAGSQQSVDVIDAAPVMDPAKAAATTVTTATTGIKAATPTNDDAATAAASLLMAVTGRAAQSPAPAKSVAATPINIETGPEGAGHEIGPDALPEGAVAAPVASVAQPDQAAPVAAIAAVFVAAPASPATPVIAAAAQSDAAPTADKPKTPVNAPSVSVSADDALPTPSAPTAAKPMPVAPTASGNAAGLADAGAAKPAAADGAASMTILFAQPGTQGASAITDVAKPAMVAERVLDMASDDGWIDQLAADIAATKSDRGDISFRLMPRHLGRLDVAMQMGDDGISLKLDTQHEATATIVAAAQGRLVEDLRQQGVRVAGAEVTHTPDQMAGRQQQGQGRGAAPDTAHLIETATERADPRDEDRATDRRGRFA